MISEKEIKKRPTVNITSDGNKKIVKIKLSKSINRKINDQEKISNKNIVHINEKEALNYIKHKKSSDNLINNENKLEKEPKKLNKESKKLNKESKKLNNESDQEKNDKIKNVDKLNKELNKNLKNETKYLVSLKQEYGKGLKFIKLQQRDMIIKDSYKYIINNLKNYNNNNNNNIINNIKSIDDEITKIKKVPLDFKKDNFDNPLNLLKLLINLTVIIKLLMNTKLFKENLYDFYFKYLKKYEKFFDKLNNVKIQIKLDEHYNKFEYNDINKNIDILDTDEDDNFENFLELLQIE